ncbi:MAG: hypothetical protein NVS3B5_06450 [Sphingomicrobium sp.]
MRDSDKSGDWHERVGKGKRHGCSKWDGAKWGTTPADGRPHAPLQANVTNAPWVP